MMTGEMPVISPIDGHVIASYAVDGAADIARKLAAARQAAKVWGTIDIASRVKILAPLRSIILAQQDELTDILVRTTGKVPTEVLLSEIYPVLEQAKFYQSHARRILARRYVATSPFAFPDARARIERRPYGVVAVISPWNYPFQLSMTPLLTALYAGNGVMLKASELSLPVAACIMSLLAGLALPGGLVQWVVGTGNAGEQLLDAGPDLVFFTGSLAVGRKVMQRAAKHPIPVLLELGGKDAMLVCEDADLRRAAHAALYGAFCNSGQACVAVERLYVQRSCHDHFLAMLREGLTALRLRQDGSGDMGPMTSERQLTIIQEHYDEAIAQGAQASGPLRRTGQYVHPILMWDVTPEMRVMREETFGPLLPMMAFNDTEHALQLANDSIYGLNASVWSRDIAKAESLAGRLQTGNWAINDVLKNIGHPALPFGGIKRSGFGRYHGAEGLRSFTYSVSGLTSHSRLPQEPNWFPYSPERYEQFKGYLDFLHGGGSFYQRLKRNGRALQAFREYSALYLGQHWHNLQSLLPWRQDF